MGGKKIAKENKKRDAQKIRKGPKIVGNIIIFLLIIAGLWFGTVKGLDAVKYVSTDDAFIDGTQIKLSSRILGRIGIITVHEGQHVTSGEVLITLDASDLKAREVQAQASLVYARKNLDLAGINLEKARDDYTRIQNLFNNAAATKEAYDHSVSALDASQARYNLGQAQVVTSTAQLGVIEAQLVNTSINTPISGTVDTIAFSQGDVVQPAQTILTVNNLDDIWVIANVKETFIRKVKPGARVKIFVDALGRKSLEGTVELIQSGIVPPSFQIGEFTKTTQRIPVKIKLIGNIADRDGEKSMKLLPGMSVEVKIRTDIKLPNFIDKQ